MAKANILLIGDNHISDVIKEFLNKSSSYNIISERNGSLIRDEDILKGCSEGLLDIAYGFINGRINRLRPTFIINTFNFTPVAKNAQGNKSKSYWINGVLPGVLAGYAQAVSSTFIHISTDLVYNGRVNRLYRESEAGGPDMLNHVGKHKYVGEQGIIANNPSHYILRTGPLFSMREGNNPSKDAVISLLTSVGNMVPTDYSTSLPRYRANTTPDIITESLDLCIQSAIKGEGKFGTYNVAPKPNLFEAGKFYKNHSKYIEHEIVHSVTNTLIEDLTTSRIDENYDNGIDDINYVATPIATREKCTLMDTSKFEEEFGIEFPKLTQALLDELSHFNYYQLLKDIIGRYPDLDPRVLGNLFYVVPGTPKDKPLNRYIDKILPNHYPTLFEGNPGNDEFQDRLCEVIRMINLYN